MNQREETNKREKDANLESDFPLYRFFTPSILTYRTELEIPFLLLNKGTEKEFKKYLGFAFAQFANKEDADRALEGVSGKKVHKRTLLLRKAVPPLDEDEKKVKVEEYKARVAAQAAQRKAEAAEKKRKKEEEEKLAKEKQQLTASEKIPNGKVSSDTIFVTSLNYKVTVRDLYTVFAAYKPKWIHMPTKRIPIKGKDGNTRYRVQNKGIAFVKFADEESQKKAVKEFNGHVVHGRPIIVDVAVDARGNKEKKKEKTEPAKNGVKEDTPEQSAVSSTEKSD